MNLYVEYSYYKTFYGSRAIDEGEFNFHAKKAQRELDRATTGKLKFALPIAGDALESVNDCLCEMTHMLYLIDQASRDVLENSGVVVDEGTGDLRGKVIKSKSSGTESITYTTETTSNVSTYQRAAVDENAKKQLIRNLVDEYLTGITDSNGINLLYLGPYPERCRHV